MCQCRNRNDRHSVTKWSKKMPLLVSAAQPKAKLTAGPTTIPLGGSVTLSCSVEPSAGWKYRWFRRTKDTPEAQFTDEENRDINVTQGGIYRCVGKRVNTDIYSLVSDETNITICFSNKVAVTRQLKGSHIIIGESITLTCEVQGGETIEWRCEWRRNGTTEKMANDKDWTFRVSESSSGEYMCQCRNRNDRHSVTKWSKKMPLLVSAAQPKAKLTAGPTTIPLGGSVTLSCSVEPSAGWKYRWFRRTKDTPEAQFTDEENRDINVTQGGIYRCVGKRVNTDIYSLVSDETNITICLTVPTPVSSSFPVLMIIGPVGGVLLVLLLVLLWHYRRSKGEIGDDHIYESVDFSGAGGNVVDKPKDVTYSLIELKNFGKESTPNKPAEGAAYSCLESRVKGRGSPGAKEEAVYSEINPEPENKNTM